MEPKEIAELAASILREDASSFTWFESKIQVTNTLYSTRNKLNDLIAEIEK